MDDGADVMAEDWDNLVILDACRYDVFRELNTIDGELRSIRSVGSQTGEFLEKTFGGKSYSDTVYVLSKPNPSNVSARLHDVINVWRDEWGSDLRTVPNDVMVSKSLEVSQQYPSKRLILHFNPPHLPFIGDTGIEIHEEHGYDVQTVWQLARQGQIELDRMWEAYKENLSVTLPYIAELVVNLPGKTVITSDHGQAFGEWGTYSHPRGVDIEVLRRVPWLEIDSDERKEIMPGSADTDLMDYSTADVEDRLKMLGYA